MELNCCLWAAEIAHLNRGFYPLYSEIINLPFYDIYTIETTGYNWLIGGYSENGILLSILQLTSLVPLKYGCQLIHDPEQNTEKTFQIVYGKNRIL